MWDGMECYDYCMVRYGTACIAWYGIASYSIAWSSIVGLTGIVDDPVDLHTSFVCLLVQCCRVRLVEIPDGSHG